MKNKYIVKAMPDGFPVAKVQLCGDSVNVQFRNGGLVYELTPSGYVTGVVRQFEELDGFDFSDIEKALTEQTKKIVEEYGNGRVKHEPLARVSVPELDVSAVADAAAAWFERMRSDVGFLLAGEERITGDMPYLDGLRKFLTAPHSAGGMTLDEYYPGFWARAKSGHETYPYMYFSSDSSSPENGVKGWRKALDPLLCFGVKVDSFK